MSGIASSTCQTYWYPTYNIAWVILTGGTHYTEFVEGAFRDGQPALDLATTRSRHIAGTKWSLKRYMSMALLKQHRMTA